MSIRAFANAKINLTLDVISKRPDGYHDIDTIMQSVSLFDTLEFEITRGEISVKTNIGTIENEDNLVYKAISLFYEKAGLAGGANCRITKRIPSAAGLGGGSADAAAALLALNSRYDNIFEYEQLSDMALLLGADVPFFILGGTVRAQGIGEQLYALPFIGDYNVLIIKKGNKLSTADMYRAIDSAGLEGQEFKSDEVEAFLDRPELLGSYIGNRFLEVLPDKSEKCDLIKSIKSSGAFAAGLSGSGPTVFGLYSDFAAAFKAYTEFKAQNLECYLCKTEEHGIIVE